jgi:hypothetical protein
MGMLIVVYPRMKINDAIITFWLDIASRIRIIGKNFLDKFLQIRMTHLQIQMTHLQIQMTHLQIQMTHLQIQMTLLEAIQFPGHMP